MLDLDRGSNVGQTQITISYRSNHSHPYSSWDDTDELGSKTFYRLSIFSRQTNPEGQFLPFQLYHLSS